MRYLASPNVLLLLAVRAERDVSAGRASLVDLFVAARPDRTLKRRWTEPTETAQTPTWNSRDTL
jgi:hypothetical protein